MSQQLPPPDGDKPTFASLARGYAEQAGISRREDGNIDVLKAAGGVRGIAESVVPGVVFLVLFTITRSLNTALIGSVAAAALFTVARLVQRQPLTQAFAGVAGVVICALVSRTTGEAKDYYLSGFVIDIVSIVVLAASVLAKWPLLGVIFGYVRNEGLEWRHRPRRARAYRWATWIMAAVMGLRLLVQVPLYLADLVDALGTTRLLMGLPLYALGLWLAWLISRQVQDPGTTGDLGTTGAPPSAETEAP
ncbi:MAG: DUF3159 domain-containing protein [Actinomycetales bacterium]